jgi:hypothetical protein
MTDLARSKPFPELLYELLEDPSTPTLAWSEGGTAWRIVDSSALEKELLPSYFGHGKLPSFVRLLNAYGFKRTKNKVQGEYAHRCFLRFVGRGDTSGAWGSCERVGLFRPTALNEFSSLWAQRHRIL